MESKRVKLIDILDIYKMVKYEYYIILITNIVIVTSYFNKMFLV